MANTPNILDQPVATPTLTAVLAAGTGTGVSTAAGVPAGAPTGTLPFRYDSTAVTGGMYFWNGAAWVKITTIL